MNAAGGVPNPNSQSGQVPSLHHVAEDYTQPEVLTLIRRGKLPPLANEKAPPPPLYMPAWKDILSEEDLNRIVAYIWSLKPKESSSW